MRFRTRRVEHYPILVSVCIGRGLVLDFRDVAGLEMRSMDSVSDWALPADSNARAEALFDALNAASKIGGGAWADGHDSYQHHYYLPVKK